ncbi:hypothetical protein U9M48_030331 [Paspalum notatum var. saurae]|uniref:DUF4371 domain-containing protein n=1 Tax=Paspalum notatum var. saurae TaxID=547442 RepID=A0AAQ3X200_PASNO
MCAGLMESQPSSSRKGKRKAQGRDLKSYFSTSNTNPSTHGSGVGNATTERKRVGINDDKFGYEVFTKTGFKQWKNAYLALPKHVGGPNSAHNRARAAFDDFDNQEASVKNKVIVHTKDEKKKYKTRVEASLAIVSYIALQGELFRGHDESETSLNKGNFLEFLDWYKLVVVSVSKYCSSMEDFFDYVNMTVSSTGASCKRKDLLIENHRTIVSNKLERGEISSGRGQHQETSLARPADTRWGSHYKTLLRIETIWESIIEVLSVVHDEQCNPSRAGGLVHTMESFSFVFIMKMMLQILRITNELSCMLQKKDQNVVEAMSLVIDVKTRLVNLRSEGYEPLLE